MAEYDPWPKLMATHESLLEGYEQNLSQEIEENAAMLSCLSQWVQAGENMPHNKI